MLTANKVTELFCIADDFCKFFCEMAAQIQLINATELSV